MRHAVRRANPGITGQTSEKMYPKLKRGWAAVVSRRHLVRSGLDTSRVRSHSRVCRKVAAVRLAIDVALRLLFCSKMAKPQDLPQDGPAVDYTKLKVPELKQLLKDRALPVFVFVGAVEQG